MICKDKDKDKDKDKVKVVFLLKNNAINDPVDRLRGRDIVSALKNKGWNVDFFDEQDSIDILVALDFDFKTSYIIKRYPSSKLVLDIQDDFITKNKKSISNANIKKDTLFGKLTRIIRGSDLAGVSIVLLYKLLSKYSTKHLLDKSDFIIASSYSLTKVLSKLKNNIVTIPDGLDRKLYGSIKYVGKIKENDAVKTICWIGTPSNIRYLALVNDSLSKIQKKNRARIKIITSDKILSDSYLKNIVGSFDFTFEFIKWDEKTFHLELAKCDIGIAPLPQGIAKSSNKILSYLACGLAVVCSGSVDYEMLNNENPEAFIFENEHEKWFEHLDSLLTSSRKLDFFKHSGQAVANNFFTDRIISKYEELFYQLFEDNLKNNEDKEEG